MKKLFIIFAFLLWLPMAYADQARHDEATQAYNSGDFATALSILIPLAEFGSATAQHNLGIMYEKGEGVIKDPKEAFDWYLKAAKQGYGPSQYNVSIFYVKGEFVPQDFVRSYMWVSIAELNNYEEAQDFKRAAEKNLSVDELIEGIDLALLCLESNYQNCGD